MINIISHGKKPVRVFICNKCSCRFDADEEDYETKECKEKLFFAGDPSATVITYNRFTIRCPDCQALLLYDDRTKTNTWMGAREYTDDEPVKENEINDFLKIFNLNK